MSVFVVGKSAYFSNLYPKNNSVLFPKQQKTLSGNKNNLVQELETLMSSKNSLGPDELKKALDEKKRLLRAIRNENTTPSTPEANQAFGYTELNTENDTKNTPKKKVNYDAKAISSAISQAKTSLSAGRVLMKARRKISELKRALARGDSDKDEVMVAINHAKQMERIAKKKKHHLELEEMVEATQKMDEKANPEEKEGSHSSPFSNTDFIQLAKDKIDAAREAIMEQVNAANHPEDLSNELMAQLSEEMMADLTAEMMSEFTTDMMSEFTDEMMSAFSDEMSELTADALEQLNETMELLENLEVIDPHMSKEDLKKLKIKHRNSEEKDLVKADMDYLKSMINLTVGKGSVPISAASPAVPAPVSFGAMSPAPVSIDISI